MLVLALAGGSCVRAPRMCVADAGCGPNAACVAGRCLTNGASAAVATATRTLYDPVDVAYLRPGDEVATAGLAVLGRGDGARALLRYAVPLAPDATVVEAYLVMERASDLDADPTPVLLHAARVVGDWDSRAASWAKQPALQEIGGSETRVSGASRSVVRIEVRALVERWRKRARDEMGVAILADTRGASATGVTFVLPARLELYVR
jgi:hypothetical protein